MCGRLNIIADPLVTLLIALLGEDADRRGFYPADEYNLAPTEQVPVVVAPDEGVFSLHRMRWWLVPSWVDEPGTRYSMFNAKAENLLTSKAFRKPFVSRRCIVPISGYYEWHRTGAQKTPYYITPEVEPGLLLAGVWDRWQGGEQTLDSFAIVTTDAHPCIKDLHHRMPVMLTREQALQWLDRTEEPRSLQRLFVPRLPCNLEVRPVSTWVNNARNKGERCVQGIARSQFLDEEGRLDLGAP